MESRKSGASALVAVGDALARTLSFMGRKALAVLSMLTRYFPSADIEMKVSVRRQGKVHLGLFPNRLCLEKRNLLTRIVRGRAEIAALLGSTGEGNWYREVPLGPCPAVEYRSEGLSTRVIVNSMLSRVEFSVPTARIGEIRRYIETRHI